MIMKLILNYLQVLMIKLGATDFDAREKVDNPEILVKATLADK
jgi:hypothetical protein